MQELDTNTLKVLKFAAGDVTRYISQLDDDTLSKLLEAAEAEQCRRIDDADYAAAYPEDNTYDVEKQLTINLIQ